MDGLARAGHNLTILSADVEKNQPNNVHYVHLEEIYPTLYSGPDSIDLMEMANENVFKSVVSFYRDFVVHECAGRNYLYAFSLYVILSFFCLVLF